MTTTLENKTIFWANYEDRPTVFTAEAGTEVQKTGRAYRGSEVVRVEGMLAVTKWIEAE